MFARASQSSLSALAVNKVVGQFLETVVIMANADGGHIFIGFSGPEVGNPIRHERIIGVEEDDCNLGLFIQGLGDISPGPSADYFNGRDLLIMSEVVIELV